MQGNSVYPTDIFSVFDYGIEKWQKGFFWPVPYDWFLKPQHDTLNIFTTFSTEDDSEIGDMPLTAIKLYLELANMLYAIKIKQELEKQGKKIKYSDKSVYFKGLVKKGVAESFMEREEGRTPKLSIRIKDFLTLQWDRIALRVYLFFAEDPWIATSRSIVKREYFTKKMKRKPFLLLSGGRVFRGKSKHISREDVKKIEDMANHFTKEWVAVADKYEVIINYKQRDYVRGLIFRQFKKVLEEYRAIREELRKYKPFHLFTGPHHSNFVRSLGQAVRRSGGKITAFSHGYDVFECLRHITSVLDWSTVDEFVLRANNCRDRIQKIIAKYPPPRNNRVKFVSEDSTFFLDLYNRFRKTTKPPSSIKTVMLIATSYRVDLVRACALPDPVYLDSEKRIIDFLVKHGYKVLYKKHPHGSVSKKLLHGSLKRDIENIEKIFSEKATIIDEPFERVMHMGDGFLFASGMGTTVWRQAICTQKPMIYINDGFHDIWFPELLESVKKRCCVVSGGFDERNRLIFNEKELINALAEKPKPTDTEFLEKYMFPGKFSTGQRGLDIDRWEL